MVEIRLESVGNKSTSKILQLDIRGQEGTGGRAVAVGGHRINRRSGDESGIGANHVAKPAASSEAERSRRRAV